MSSMAALFRHRGADNSDVPMERREITSTGRMLSAPFTETTASARPQPPPECFNYRAQIKYDFSNPFSNHDNRNTIQERGEYFGDGRVTRTLGRRLERDNNLNATDVQFLAHHCRNPIINEYCTETASAFCGRPISDPPTRRLFPRLRAEPTPGPMVPLSTTTSDWFRDVTMEAQKKAQVTTRVLANSQQPYPLHNPWKYSYKGLPDLYPPFSPAIKQVPHTVDNILNRYGAAFKTSSATAHTQNAVK